MAFVNFRNKSIVRSLFATSLIISLKASNGLAQAEPAADEAAPPTSVQHQQHKRKEGKTTHFTSSKLEQHVLKLINQDRENAKVPTLKLDPHLSKLARDFAEDMQKNNFFSHQNLKGEDAQGRATAAGITCGVYENLGWRSGPDPAEQMLDELEKSFMAEPEGEKNHRYIVLYPKHCCVGVGVVVDKDQVYLVQEFTDSAP